MSPYRLFCCLFAVFFISVLISCQEDNVSYPEPVVYYNDFPVSEDYKSGWEKFSVNFKKDSNYVNEFDLTIQEKDYYKSNASPLSTLNSSSKMIINEDLEVHFFPLNQDTAIEFQYVYKFNCLKDPKNFRFADVAYPNPCQGKDLMAKARAFLVNKTDRKKNALLPFVLSEQFLRLFYG